MGKDEFWQIIGPSPSKGEFEWLRPLRPFVSSIVVFGCWDTGDTNDTCREPYALLRILEGTRAIVVDKELKYIRNAQRWLEHTRVQHPEFDVYDIDFVVADMTEVTDNLPRNHFDVAYCNRVLYYMKCDSHKLRTAVKTMARVVKPGGWVVAVEGIELDTLLEEAGLEKEKRWGTPPEDTYFYRKPTSSE